jgi:hypothetical protein
VPHQGGGNAPVFAVGNIVTLAAIIEMTQLDHAVVQSVLGGAGHREAVVPAVDGEEAGFVRRFPVRAWRDISASARVA